jgi:hypothetical protein
MPESVKIDQLVEELKACKWGVRKECLCSKYVTWLFDCLSQYSTTKSGIDVRMRVDKKKENVIRCV